MSRFLCSWEAVSGVSCGVCSVACSVATGAIALSVPQVLDVWRYAVLTNVPRDKTAFLAALYIHIHLEV